VTELGHLLIADAVAQQLSCPEEATHAVYLGAIAPDAHRIAVGVDYRDLHFRGRPGSQRQLGDFLRVYLRPALAEEDPLPQAFYAGWLSHICADAIWRRRIRAEMPDLWKAIAGQTSPEAKRLRSLFHSECDWVDLKLYRQHTADLERVRWLLGQPMPGLTVPPLNVGDIYRWRRHVVQHLLPPEGVPLEEPQYATLVFTLGCLLEAQEETMSVLNWEKKQIAEGHADTPGQNLPLNLTGDA